MTLEERIKEIIFDQLCDGWNGLNKPEDIKKTHNIRDDLKADSLDEVELIMRFEEEFECEIEDADVQNIKTVGDIIEYAKNNMDNKTSLNEPQPPSIKNDEPCIWDLVLSDMAERDAMGEQKHGKRLQPHNGRDCLIDAYQEALDLVVYLRQAIYERNLAVKENIY